MIGEPVALKIRRKFKRPPASLVRTFASAQTSFITDAMQAGESVAIAGFGTFSVGDRAARTGRNPQTGETINIPAAKIPKFKAGKALKDAVN